MISIVIPTLNEANNIPGLLAVLCRDTAKPEIIVADGGSTDGTPEIAAEYGSSVLSAPPGRGAQLRFGASRARGDIILFLHADCRYPKDGLRRIEMVLEEHPNAIGGNHQLLFNGDDKFSRWLNGFYAWIRTRGFYYGDSGIFMRRNIYEAIGGIRPIALMEDFDLVRRMEKLGDTVTIAEPPLVTSSRRFAGRHPIAIICGWLKIHALYYLGYSPERLARIYDSERRADHSLTTEQIAPVRDANSESSITKGGIT